MDPRLFYRLDHPNLGILKNRLMGIGYSYALSKKGGIMTGRISITSAKPNADLSMSPMAKAKMRATEKAVYQYYNDMGKQRGNCTWGAGILAHRGVCTAEELGRKVSMVSVDIEFERRVADAERLVRRHVTRELNQAQFDALVSLTYNAGADGAKDTYDYVNRGDFLGAAANISRMIKVRVTGPDGRQKKVIAPGLIKRRTEESAPFRTPSGSQANILAVSEVR